MTPNEAIDLILKLEGGYVNDPHDPGGETKYGISKRSHPGEDIANLTTDRAAAIYLAEYWTPTAGRIADIAPRLAVAVFDSAVNQGNGAAVKMLQGLLHAAQDGIIGPKTLEALQDAIDAHGEGWVLAQFPAARVLRYASNANWLRYGRGWMVRVFTVMAALIDEPGTAIASGHRSVLPELLDQIAELIKVARSEID